MVGSIKEISLGEGFGAVAVSVNGARVVIHADGRVEQPARAKPPRAVPAQKASAGFSDAAVLGERVVYDTAAGRATIEATKRLLATLVPEVGDTMPDGTIYAGISPKTGTALYTMPADAPLTMNWERAMKCAASLAVFGHNDWRLPTKAELNLLFNNRAAIGGFDVSGSDPSGRYWSATEDPDCPDFAWMERFSDGIRGWPWKGHYASVRPVRSGP